MPAGGAGWVDGAVVFDSHCHLTDLPDPEGALAAARAVGVTGLLTCGYDSTSNRAVLALRARHPGLPCALGLHPWYADQALAPLLALVVEARPTAVGELGLDLWERPPRVPLARQIEVLEAQLEVAERLRLPVTLHCRRALGELLGVLRRFPNVRGALHAAAGTMRQLRPFLELGFRIGVGGAVTWPRAERARRLAAELPLDAILLETDAPSLRLQGVAPSEGRPAHLPQILTVLASLRGESAEQLERVTDDNARDLFGSVGAASLGLGGGA